MKILHVVPSFGLGGMEKVIAAIVNGLPAPCRHEIVALDNRKDASCWIERADVHFIEYHRPHGRAAFFSSLYALLRHCSPRLLMTYNWGATDAIWLGRLAGVPHILHSEHGFNAEEAASTLWKRNLVRAIVYRLATKVIVVSHSLSALLGERLRLRSQRVVWIPNGVDTDRYCPDPTVRAKTRQELGFDPADLVVTFVGRLDPIKNLSFLVDVFEQCRTQDGRFRLLLVGEGPELSRIEALCQAKVLMPFVRFMGAQLDVLPFLRVSDTFVLTSLREQMPMSLIEAMAVGLPVVTSSVGDIQDIVTTGKQGFACDVLGGVGPFSEAICKLRDVTLRRQMGQAARERVVATLNQAEMVRRYNDLILGFI